MKSYNNIYLLRHLKTLNNDLHIISGQRDSEILKTGCFKINLNQFDIIYCSPSLRCIKTIKLLANQSDTACSIVCDKRLLERNMGSLEGMLKKEAQKKYPELFVGEYFNVFKTPPRGESYECFKRRVEDFYNECLCAKKGDDILICSHNQTLKLLRLVILERRITYQSWSEYSFKNGYLTEILF